MQVDEQGVSVPMEFDVGALLRAVRTQLGGERGPGDYLMSGFVDDFARGIPTEPGKIMVLPGRGAASRHARQRVRAPASAGTVLRRHTINRTIAHTSGWPRGGGADGR
jgi:hypothetical protein